MDALLPETDPRIAQAEMLRSASTKANRLNELAIVSQMINNPGAAKAMGLAAKMQSEQYTPERMGNQGFALPATGQFVESPMFVDEKRMARQATKDLADQRIADKQVALAATLAAKEAADAKELEYKKGRDADSAELKKLMLTQTLAARGAGSAEKAAEKAEKAAEKADAKVSADLDKNTTKFSAVLEKAGVPEFSTALEIAEARLNKHPVGKLPGYGRLEGAIPDWAAGEEQQMSRSDMTSAANMLLKIRSGAAVTESEALRFLREVASGKGFSEPAMRNGWANVRKQFDAKRENLVSGVGDDVLKEYNSRSAFPLTRGKNKPAAPAGGAGKPPACITQAEWDHMTPEDRKLFK